MTESQKSPCRITVMASGFGSNFQALIDGIANGSLPHSRIISLIANRKSAHATARADKAGAFHLFIYIYIFAILRPFFL